MAEGGVEGGEGDSGEEAEEEVAVAPEEPDEDFQGWWGAGLLGQGWYSRPSIHPDWLKCLVASRKARNDSAVWNRCRTPPEVA